MSSRVFNREAGPDSASVTGSGPRYLAGLATDFCVKYSALDGRAQGFEVYVVEDGVRGIDTQGSLAQAWREMDEAGVKVVTSEEIIQAA